MMVWPSGFWRTKSVIAMVPPPPDLFSTTVDCPHATCRCCPSSRPITSVVPPGAAGIMMRTASVGRQSACAARGRAVAAARPAAPDSALRRERRSVIWRFPVVCFFVRQSSPCGAQRASARRPREDAQARLLAAENFEDVGEVGQFLSAGWRGAADVVENLSVLLTVVRNALDAAVLVEIHRDHALIDHLLGQERGLLGAR